MSKREDARSVPAWAWPLLPALVACVPFFRGLSLSNVFHVRDLSMFFWPRHLWIRESLLRGVAPWWDPYAAGGQPVYPDALNQLFLLPVVLFRVALPAIVGFNLMVVTPFPLAALGAWLFLRRHFSPVSAAIGAAVFAMSGPVVSTSNFPNMSWSIAWIPWMLWAAERDRHEPSARNLAILALVAAGQVLSGEPVTMAGTVALVLAYVTCCGGEERSRRGPLVAAGRCLAAIGLAGLAAAVQLVPMAAAASQSLRGASTVDNFWSLHPLWLIESLLPHVFGNGLAERPTATPWMTPLNSTREPFFYSMYVGPIVLLLAVFGALAGRRAWRAFWSAVALAGVVLAVGDHSPVYPALQAILPPMRSFRFPVKFFIFTSFALAMLAAAAVEVLQQRGGVERLPRPAVRTLIGTGAVTVAFLVALIGLVVAVPFTGARMFYELALAVGVQDPVAGAEFLFRTVPPVATRVLLLLLAGGFLLYLGWAAKREGHIARALLVGLATIEVLAVNLDLAPVMAATRIGPPAWAAAMGPAPAERFYVGGKFDGGLDLRDPDVAQADWAVPPGLSILDARVLFSANLAMSPNAWHIRELISYDLPLLWPITYNQVVKSFQSADTVRRTRFLQRGGVRYCLLAVPPRPGAAPLAHPRGDYPQLMLYDCVPDARRVYVVPGATVVPRVGQQLAALFEDEFDFNTSVMITAEAARAAGAAGPAGPASARIVHDEADEVVVEATAEAGGGYLVLLDTYAPGWSAHVDGEVSELLQANGLYRAVRLAPGRHEVRFSYSPQGLFPWLFVSTLSGVALMIVALKPPKTSV